MSSTDFDLSYVHALHTKFYSSHPTLGAESSASSSKSLSSASASSTTTARPHTAQASAAPIVQDHNAMSRPSTQPISIPQQPSQQDLNVDRRRGADTPEVFRSVDWEPSKTESLKRASSAGPSQSANTKIKAQKENAIFRKTSQKYGKLRALKDSYLHGGRVQRPSGGDPMEGVEGSAVLPEHATSSATHHKGIQRFYPSNRLIQSLKAPRHDTPQPVNRPSPTLSSSSTMSYQDQYPQQYFTPQMPADMSGGDAARRAAAQTSSHRVRYVPKYQASRDIARSRIGSIPGASDSGADLASSADVEIMDVVEPEILTTASGLNPVEALPTEIVALIFSHLDASSLKTCQRVAKSWSRIAVDPLIWRDQYLQQYQRRTYVAPAPIQIGGIGVGIPNQPLQDWELMHDARKRIDKNWARGDLGAKGIYLAGHTDSVYCVQFDEQKIITGSRDRTIRVWDINTYKCIKVIGGPNVRPVPGPKQLRTVEYPKFYHAEPSVNGTAYGNNIYHVPSDFHSASILCLQYDHEILVTGSSDNDLLVWDVNTYEPLRRLKQHTGGVLDVAFDEKHIVSCSKDCTIIVWDRKTLEPIRTLTGHRGPVNAVQLRGNLLVSASGDGVARLWDLSKMQCVREFPQKERGLAAVEFSDDAKYVLAGGNDHITYKFDVATGAEVETFTGHTQLVRSLFLDTQNRRVVSGSYDLDLRVYDYDTGALLGRFNEWTTSWMLAAKCDYRRIVSTSQDGRILMIDFGRDLNGQLMPGVELLNGVQ